MATDWNKALIDAVKQGDEEKLRQAIQNKADVNVKWGKSERTPLHFAAENGQDNLCQLLLEDGANAGDVDDENRVPLHYAAEKDHDIVAHLLIARNAESVETKDENEMTPLHWASKYGSCKVAKILVDANAKVDEKDFFGGTSLHYAAAGGFKDLCQMLIDANASVDEKDTRQRNDRTPLHYASEGGYDEICKMLLDAGSKVNEKRVWANYTPLHMACQKGHLSTCLLLIRRGADIHSANSHEKTPLDLIRDEDSKKLLRDEYERIENRRQLMEYGHRKLDIVKLFLFGYPEAGKTTLHKTLTKKEEKSSSEDDYTYKMTPGIDVGRYTIDDAGQFHTWDCAGHIEFHVTHGMFLGAGNSIFLAVYDISKESDGTKVHSSDTYWLSFIKSLHPATDEKVKVIMVATHLDQVKDRNKARIVAQKILKTAQDTYGKFLDIQDDLVIVDGRVNDVNGMAILRKTLKNLGEDIKGSQEVPNVCDQLLEAISSWKKDGKRVLKWGHFLEHVKLVEPRMDEDFLKKIVRYLHDMGEIYLAEMHEKTTQVVLDTQWFSYDIIGSAFAGDEFRAHFEKLPDQPYYSKEELRKFFADQIDVDQVIPLLEHVDLLHDCEHDRYLLPGKLPATMRMPKVYLSWKTAAVIKGRQVKCVDKTDMFNPNVFPCIQKILLDKYDDEHESTKISRSAVTFTWKNVKGMVQMVQNKTAINIAVQSSGKSSNETCQCHQLLETVVNLIRIQLIQKSPGTATQVCYISPDSVKLKDDLEGVWTYSKEDIIKGEKREGLVVHQTTGTKEKITDILCPGFDMMFLEQDGSCCRFQWLPHEAARRCFKRLDSLDKLREDYRTVAEALALEKYEITEIEKNTSKGESLTVNMIEEWCQRKSRKMTISMLHLLLDRLSLLVNRDPIEAIDEVLSEYGEQELQRSSDEPAFDIGISENIATWRLKLKYHWTRLKTDLEPDKLVPYLAFLPSDMFAELEEAPSVQRRHQNAERLLHFLLESKLEDWPKFFLDGLMQTNRPVFDLLEKGIPDFPGTSRESSQQQQQHLSRKRSADKMEN